MRGYARKWGNSLAVRLPAAFAEEIQLRADAPIEMGVENGRFFVVPAVEDVPSLEALLARVTPETRHSAIQWGAPQGNEVW